MTELPTGLVVIAGAILASIFSVLLTLISLIVSKEQTTSNFRQKWIDALRDDLAIFLTSANNISVQTQLLSGSRKPDLTPKDAIATISDDISSAYASYHRIILRLNPEEHQKLSGLIVNLERSLSKASTMANAETVGDMCAEIDAESHIVLKNEWNQVKHGEFTFRLVKYIAVVLLLIAVLAASVSVIGYISKNNIALQDTTPPNKSLNQDAH